MDYVSKITHKANNLWNRFMKTRMGAAMRNKFVFSAVIFALWLLLFDQNNLADRKKSIREYNLLLEEQSYYLNKIEEDKKRITELKTNTENLEKFAREQYLMKKDNEDIFVIVDE